MGDTAEMMLDGTLCQQCGSYIEEGEARGQPRFCEDCRPKNVTLKAAIERLVRSIR